MKAFKTYKAAAALAGDLPIIAVGDLYLVSEDGDLGDMALTNIAVLTKDNLGHTSAGHVTVSKLVKLGNANWATPAEDWKGKVEVDWYGKNKGELK